jgi:MFS family permease
MDRTLVTKPGVPVSAWRNLVAAVAAIAVFGFALGLMFPLLSLILVERGYSDDLIGLNAAMSPIGILTSSLMIPWLARRFGVKPVILGAAFTTAMIVLSYKILWSIEWWFVLRFLQGMCVSTLFVLSESWIVKFAEDGHRGKIVAIYASVLSASFACGPLLISIIGVEGWRPFLIGAAVLVSAMAPLASVNEPKVDRRSDDRRPSLWSVILKAPILLAAVGIYAVFDAATLSLLSVYGVRMGLDIETASLALTALVAGNVLLQFPIGWLADLYPKRQVMAGCAAATIIGLLVLPFCMGSWLMWPVLLIIGSTGYGLYGVALAELGDRFHGDELVAGSAAFAAMWGIGALIGATVAGFAMAVFGPHGLPLSLALFLVLFLVAIITRDNQRRRHL